MLTLRAANGLEIPYVGYLHLEIEIDGVKVPNCGVLVLKDTPATSLLRTDVPGLLRTNVLAQIPKFGAFSNKGLIVSPGGQDPVPLVLFA